MSSKNRMTVNFSSKELFNFIEFVADKNHTSRSNVIETLLRNSLQEKLQDPKAFLENQLFGRNKNLTPWFFGCSGLTLSFVYTSPDEMGETHKLSILVKKDVRHYNGTLDGDDFISKGGIVQGSLSRQLFLDITKNKIKESMSSFVDYEPNPPQMILFFIDKVHVECQLIVPESKLLREEPLNRYIAYNITVDVNRIPFYHDNLSNKKFYCLDFCNIKYKTFEQVATQGWNRAKYSHLLHIDRLNTAKADRLSKSKIGGYFIGVLYEEKAFVATEDNGYTLLNPIPPYANSYPQNSQGKTNTVAVKFFDEGLSFKLNRVPNKTRVVPAIDDEYLNKKSETNLF